MIKKNPVTNLWEVSVSRRPPGGMSPRSLKRINIKSEAKAKLIERELIILLDKKISEARRELWKDVVHQCLEFNKGSSWNLKTFQNYETALHAYTLPKWAEIPIKDITTHQIKELLLKDLGELSESTRKSMAKYINAVFTFAFEKGLISANPMPRMKFRIGGKIETVLTEDQVKVFLAKAKEMEPEWYPVWATAVLTGMRSGELFALRWESVDIPGRKIVVRESWDSKNGFKAFTKNRGHRILELPNSLAPILSKLYETRTNEFVLPRITKWERGEQARELQIFLFMIGLPKIRFHDLRSTYCTILLNRGVEPAKVMMLAGFADLKTLAIYMRKTGILLKGATRVLDDFVTEN